MELSVIVPCLNEQDNLDELTDRLDKVFQAAGLAGRAEIVFIDDGSTDQTWARMQALKATRYPAIVLRQHPENRGMTPAWQTGLEAASGRLVCILDADMQYPPEDILRLLAEKEATGVDIVQGWRSYVGHGPRFWYSRGLNHLLNLVFGMKLTDNKSDFVLCRREVLQDLFSFKGRYAYWQSFIMIAAHRKGYTYREIKTVFGPRRHGTSFLSNAPLRVILLCMIDIARAVVEYRLRTPQRARPGQGE